MELTLIALLLACAVDTPAPPCLEACGALNPELGEWCVVQAIGACEGLSGEDAARACEGLGRDARAWCYEAAVRLETEPLAAPASCARIGPDLPRSSCYLHAAARVTHPGASIGDVLAACAHTGELFDSCLGHIPGRRGSYYERNGGNAALLAETRAVLLREPRAASCAPYAHSTGQASSHLDGLDPSTDPCTAFVGELASRCAGARQAKYRMRRSRAGG